MRNLRLPEGIASVTIDEQTFAGDKNGTLRDLDDHIAREIMAHDPRIIEFTPGTPDDPAGMPGANDKRVMFLARAGTMDRIELFAAGRALRVSMPANLRTELLREIVLRAAASAPDDDLPLILGGEKKEDGDPSTLTVAELADANRGNDSLGRQGQHLSSGAGGATFSQASLTPVPSAAVPPPPSGQGLVTATGTQQPPYNQLSTETGKPAHDVGAAPFPINVPPIDPATGAPFREGDPRIPPTALPIARIQPGDAPAPDAHDAHVHRVANAIEDAAFNLAQASGASGSPLFAAEQAGK